MLKNAYRLLHTQLLLSNFQQTHTHTHVCYCTVSNLPCRESPTSLFLALLLLAGSKQTREETQKKILWVTTWTCNSSSTLCTVQYWKLEHSIVWDRYRCTQYGIWSQMYRPVCVVSHKHINGIASTFIYSKNKTQGYFTYTSNIRRCPCSFVLQ